MQSVEGGYQCGCLHVPTRIKLLFHKHISLLGEGESEHEIVTGKGYAQSLNNWTVHILASFLFDNRILLIALFIFFLKKKLFQINKSAYMHIQQTKISFRHKYIKHKFTFRSEVGHTPTGESPIYASTK